jgi:beta-lactamase regulating signal transducer with metallopeptidase domain
MIQLLADPTVAFAATLALKVTALLLAGAGIARALRRTPSATHFAWLLALSGSLLLAGLALVPSGIEVPVPIAVTPPAATSPATRTYERLFTESVRLPAPVASAPVAHPAANLPSNDRFTWPLGGIVTAWLIGLGLVIGRHVLGQWGLSRLARTSEPITDAGWLELLDRLRRESGVRRPVALRRSNDVGSPIVCGVARAVILLPADAMEWPQDRRTVVLLHELAHVARGDAAAQLLASLVCALYWFHPGVWLAARRLRAESEKASTMRPTCSRWRSAPARCGSRARSRSPWRGARPSKDACLRCSTCDASRAPSHATGA